MEINLETLFQEQFKLDKTIQEKHQVTYQDTLIKRILALLVELGECLNETRSFKFWSYKKPSPNEVILEEYVDALHFYLSLGLCLNIDKFVYEYNLISEDINLVFLSTSSKDEDILILYGISFGKIDASLPVSLNSNSLLGFSVHIIISLPFLAKDRAIAKP